jgi:hypothetical protein
MTKKQEQLLLEIMKISETIGVFKSDFANAIANNSSDVDDIRTDMFNFKNERIKLISEFRKTIK